MKNLLIILFALCLISCNQEDNEIFESNNNPVIAEVHFQYFKYKFDEIGRLIRYENNFNNKIIEFTYANDQITEVVKMDFNENIISTQNILYDNENRISAINDRTFEFDEVNGRFIETSTYFEHSSTNDGYTGTDIWFNFYTISSNDYFTNISSENLNFGGWQYNYSSDENLSTGQLYESEYNEELGGFNMNNGNLTSDYGYDVMTSDRFDYDTNTNPLFSETSNIRDIFSFLNIYLPKIEFLFSSNNCIKWYFAPSSPEATITNYNYTFNSFNLPINISTNESDNIIQYYYQGDVIPE